MEIVLNLTLDEWATLTGAAGFMRMRAYYRAEDGTTLEESTESTGGEVARFYDRENAEVAEALFNAFARFCEANRIVENS